jgi:hypothetical protein
MLLFKIIASFSQADTAQPGLRCWEYIPLLRVTGLDNEPLPFHLDYSFIFAQVETIVDTQDLRLGSFIKPNKRTTWILLSKMYAIHFHYQTAFSRDQEAGGC